MKQRLFGLSLTLIVTLLASVPLYLVMLLESKPGTTWVVTSRYFVFVVAFLSLATLLHWFLVAIPMRPEIRKASGAAFMTSLILFSWRVFPPGEQRHEALGHIFHLWAVSLVSAFAMSVCWEFWCSSRKRNALSGSKG